ncbi:MAG: hypothetical protein ACTSX9_01705 [Candidatus Njordarchaeales archaeon]
MASSFSEIELNKIRIMFLFLAQKLGGESGLQIAAALLSNGNLTEEEIAKITGLPLTDVRNIIATFKSEGLIFSIKERDPETGWTLNYWSTDPLIIYRAFKNRLKQAIYNLSRLAELLEREEIYVCQECGHKVLGEEAEKTNFTCPVCGAELKRQEELPDFKEVIKEVKRVYEELGL